MTAEQKLAKIELVTAKLTELRQVVEGSLSIRAVGGVHIANEIIALLPELTALKAAVEAELVETPVEGE